MYRQKDSLQMAFSTRQLMLIKNIYTLLGLIHSNIEDIGKTLVAIIVD